MTEATQTLAQLKKTSKLTRLAFHKNGPKSFRRGQGALLNALLENDGATQRELVHVSVSTVASSRASSRRPSVTAT